MSNTPGDPSAQPGGLKDLFGSPLPKEEAGSSEAPLSPWDVPVALPVEGPIEDAPEAIPVAVPVDDGAFPVVTPPFLPPPFLPASPTPHQPPANGETSQPTAPEAVPADEPVAVETEPAELPVAEAVPVETPPPLPEAPVAATPVAPPPPAARPTAFDCPVCSSSNPVEQTSCSDCGYYFSPADLAAAGAGEPAAASAPGGKMASRSHNTPPSLIQGRYELKELLGERHGLERFRAVDLGEDGKGPGIAVMILREPLAPATPLPEPEPITEQMEASDEILPSFDDEIEAGFPVTEVIPGRTAWPSISWERKLLHAAAHPCLPAELAHFIDETHEYFVEEIPTGQLLWDAWDDPDASSSQKFGYLAEVAETLHRLHQCSAILEGLRPDIIVVGTDGHIHFTDISDLLPLPVPLQTPVRASLYTAPELLAAQQDVDARADLYSFGAMLYALSVGRELNERTDFDGPGNPKPFIPRFPDTHPAFGRLMMKTFRKEVEARFPTDEAGKEDATGFTELIRTLEVLRRTYDNVRLEIASWTSTGIVRTGNEDAFALMHACESRQDDLGESALVLLCDGMGGYEAGEVAAALTIQALRKNLSQLAPFKTAMGASPFVTDPATQMSRPEGHAAEPLNVEATRQAIKAALRDANKQVFQASRAPGSKRRGMGCTAEVVYVDGQNVVVGHVGDSRTYHLHEGRMIQMTRDQTLVNRLVELGSLSPEEAETHPRRNELQQAIGGQPDVEPGLYHGRLVPGDWVVVCSDGLTNHVNARDLQQMLQSEATSAEMAARRLVNLTLIEGATDNVTVVVIRAT
jgi:serine/threonine protein phosphatase PrpC